VAKTLLASMLHFDATGEPPQIILVQQDLRLRWNSGSTDLPYLYPFQTVRVGVSFHARVDVRNTGGVYRGPMRIELASIIWGARRVFSAAPATFDGPTTAYVRADKPVPILAADDDTLRVQARVTYSGAGGDQTLEATQPYIVALLPNGGQSLTVHTTN